MNKIAIIIPYQNTDNERFPLLLLCLDQFKELRNHVDIFLHEMGQEKTTDFLKVTGYKFTKNNRYFRKGWCINSIFNEYISNSNLYSKISIVDVDIISKDPNRLIKGIMSIKNGQPWSFLIWLPLTITNEVVYKFSNNISYKNIINFIENKLVNENNAKVNKSLMTNLAGGIITTSVKTFKKIKGIPESFDGTWGGEDNAFWMKLTALGYSYQTYSNRIFHLFHNSRLPYITKKYMYLHNMKRWKKDDWLKHLEEIGDNWGKNE